MDYGEYINGFIERDRVGVYEGCMRIERIDISPIEATFFKDGDGVSHIRIRRKPVLEYDSRTEKFVKRRSEPFWEAYLTKQIGDGVVQYAGEFYFLRFKFSIVGVWDKVLGKDKQRLNLYVERRPMNEQNIINKIKERNANERNT